MLGNHSGTAEPDSCFTKPCLSSLCTAACLLAGHSVIRGQLRHVRQNKAKRQGRSLSGEFLSVYPVSAYEVFAEEIRLPLTAISGPFRMPFIPKMPAADLLTSG